MWAAWAGAATWAATALLTWRGLVRYRPLDGDTAHEDLLREDAPLVSVIVPARNEEGRVLAGCLSSILAQDYGNFEVVAVNDRSTDATPIILRAISKADQRLSVVDGAEPPPGWLGKPFALQQALERARGAWVLATDADMIFAPSALRTAMAYSLERQVDALTFIPHFEARSFWERVMIPTWSWVMLVYVLFYRAGNPRSQGAVGIGGFFLIRRAALERVGGYVSLKDEVMEDMRLAEKLKAAGARVAFEYAPRLVSTRMYTNFREMWECSTKNWFSGMKFSPVFAFGSVLSMYLFAVAPPLAALVFLVALIAGADASLWLLFLPCFLVWLVQVLIFASFDRRCQVPVVYAWTTPLGLALLYTMLLDSALRVTTGRGVTWKGRKVYERGGGVSPPRARRPLRNSTFQR